MDAEIGIIGGTGFYRLFLDAQDIEVETPYGSPSAPLSIATLNGRKIAFLPRHGRHHQFLPHHVPYRANLWALHSLGIRQIIGFNVMGSFQPHIRRGDFVFCDQFIDMTTGRADTFFTGAAGAHVSMAYPYCPQMRAAAIDAVQPLTGRFHPQATVVVIQGPRFGTVAENRWFVGMGWDVGNMTQYPEVALARELQLCYMNLSYITDYDVAASDVAGDDSLPPCSHAMIVEEFNRNEPRVELALRTIVASIPGTDDCSCRSALVGAYVAR